MPEIKKRKIAIASILKPVNDTRTAEKIAQSLADTRQFEVHVFGFPADALPAQSFVVHSHSPFKRLSFTRIIVPWITFRKIYSLKPALLIISTHELIGPALLLKTITGCKIVYDVQENYFRNILHTLAFPFFIRPLLAIYVRIKEILSALFIDHFFLAEKAYDRELWFIGKRFTILENKLKRPEYFRMRKRNANRLLFSGTLAETTGVFKAIEIANQLHSLDQRITLTIVGYCPQQFTLNKIKKTIEGHSHLRLIGGNKLISHHEILTQIEQADAGIIAYPDNPSTINSIPTKLYEYLGYRLPILLTYHPVWTKICMPYSAAIVFDPTRIDAPRILETLKHSQFYTLEPTDVYWDSEQPRLIRQVLFLLN
jgi:hypothetical protein